MVEGGTGDSEALPHPFASQLGMAEVLFSARKISTGSGSGEPQFNHSHTVCGFYNSFQLMGCSFPSL